MSLTSELNDRTSVIRKFMDSHFPNARVIQKSARPTINNHIDSTILPQGVVPYHTIGTAIDYRIRYYFKITNYRNTVAFGGASQLHPQKYDGMLIDCEHNNITNKINLHSQFFHHLESSINEIQPNNKRLGIDNERELCRLCLILAMYEELFRAGVQINSPLYRDIDSLSDILNVPLVNWIEDLCALSWNFYDNFKYLLDSKHVELNPGFIGSCDVGGADADLILDGCLIDIKSTIKPGLEKLWLYQILGYALLDYDNVNKIDSLAILYARQGFILRWDILDFVRDLSGQDDFCDLGELRLELKNLIAPNYGVRRLLRTN